MDETTLVFYSARLGAVRIVYPDRMVQISDGKFDTIMYVRDGVTRSYQRDVIVAHRRQGWEELA